MLGAPRCQGRLLHRAKRKRNQMSGSGTPVDRLGMFVEPRRSMLRITPWALGMQEMDDVRITGQAQG